MLRSDKLSVRLSHLAPIMEQVCNSIASLFLTIVLAAILPTAQFGSVTFVLIALTYPIAIIDGILGTAIVFDKRRSRFTVTIRRGTIVVASLAALLCVEAVAVATFSLLPGTVRDTLASVGGAPLVTALIAVYCLLLGIFEQLRRISYASEMPGILLAVNVSRVAALGLLVVAIRTGVFAPDLLTIVALVTGTLAAAVAWLALVLVVGRKLAFSFSSWDPKIRYIARTARHFSANAVTVLAYSSLELMLVSVFIYIGDPGAAARYRGLQLALLVVNLLGVAAENANAARNFLEPEEARARYVRSAAILLVTGFGAVLAFLAIGQWGIGLLLGPDIVPTRFELICTAILMSAHIIRVLPIILLKFANSFTFVMRLFVGAAVLEAIMLALLVQFGLGDWALPAFVFCHVLTTIVLVMAAKPDLKAAFVPPAS